MWPILRILYRADLPGIYRTICWTFYFFVAKPFQPRWIKFIRHIPAMLKLNLLTTTQSIHTKINVFEKWHVHPCKVLNFFTPIHSIHAETGFFDNDTFPSCWNSLFDHKKSRAFNLLVIPSLRATCFTSHDNNLTLQLCFLSFVSQFQHYSYFCQILSHGIHFSR